MDEFSDIPTVLHQDHGGLHQIAKMNFGFTSS